MTQNINQPSTRQRFASLTDPGHVLHPILSSEGEQVYWKMKALEAAYFVFAGNAEELLVRISYLENAENRLALWDLKNRHRFELLQKDTTRLFHNFVASAFALRDHTQVIA